MSLDVAGQPGWERKASGRCEVPPHDVGKGLDPKRDERKTSYAAGDKMYRGRRDIPWKAGRKRKAQ